MYLVAIQNICEVALKNETAFQNDRYQKNISPTLYTVTLKGSCKNNDMLSLRQLSKCCEGKQPGLGLQY